MDYPELPEKLKVAGADYYKQLKALGLKPEGILWMYEHEHDEFVLWLIWSGIDRFGPLAVSRMLFKAYNASALTQEIDPFSVTVKSPMQVISRSLVGAMEPRRFSKFTSNPMVSFQMRPVSMAIEADINADPDEGVTHSWDRAWIYYWQDKNRKTLDVNRDWRRFTENVERLAA